MFPVVNNGLFNSISAVLQDVVQPIRYPWPYAVTEQRTDDSGAE